jgi:hypothetical protein
LPFSISNELDRERLRNFRGETETEIVRNSKVLVDFEIHALDLAISRFTHSLAVYTCWRCDPVHRDKCACAKTVFAKIALVTISGNPKDWLYYHTRKQKIACSFKSLKRLVLLLEIQTVFLVVISRIQKVQIMFFFEEIRKDRL